MPLPSRLHAALVRHRTHRLRGPGRQHRSDAALAVLIAAMGGLFGLQPMSIAVSNSFWLAAIVLTIVSFVMSLRQGMGTRV